MKFWEKIFICTLIIFEVFFIPSSIYLINRSFKTDFEEAISSGINEQSRICSFIRSNLTFLKIKNMEEKWTVDDINIMINKYLSDFKNGKVYLQVFDEEYKVVFNNLSIKLPKNRPELRVTSDKLKYVIRDVNGEEYFFVVSKVNVESNYYEFCYIKNVSKIYENRKKLLMLLFKVNIFVALLLVIVMIILSKFIVKPINKLIKSTKKIATGNFSERVSVISDDEVGVLSKNFNDMADVIEGKIHELKKSSDDKQRFIDNLTHELRTPLTSIIGYADFLRTAQYDEETLLNSLTYIYDEGKRLEKLSSELMKLINLRKENFKMKKDNTENLLLKVETAMTHKLKAKNIKLKIVANKIDLLMDIELMTILITNLIDNAIKASKSGDTIELNIFQDQELNLIVEVKDKGVGIPPDDINKVFEPFFMVDKSRERANNGAGIGLALCNDIAKIHNGKLQIYSELGKGTTVRLVIIKANL